MIKQSLLALNQGENRLTIEQALKDPEYDETIQFLTRYHRPYESCYQ